MPEPRPPTADDAMRVAREMLAEPIASAERFSTGSGHRVYDVTAVSGRRVVVRFADSRGACEAGVVLSRTLRALGVPLPEMLAHHLSESDGGPAWTVLERLPGTDLGHVYSTLTDQEKLDVLDHVMRAQAIV